MGGFVANNRLMGQIAVARALGDRHFKTNGSASSLTCEPDIGICQLQEGDEFFLLACDGLFDVCTSQQAVDECRKLFAIGPLNGLRIADVVLRTHRYHRCGFT